MYTKSMKLRPYTLPTGNVKQNLVLFLNDAGPLFTRKLFSTSCSFLEQKILQESLMAFTIVGRLNNRTNWVILRHEVVEQSVISTLRKTADVGRTYENAPFVVTLGRIPGF